MNINELNRYLQSLPDKILSKAANIVEETATEYYKKTFDKKAFDGNPWTPAKTPKRTGSLLIDSHKLQESIQPTFVSKERVVISAGNDKVEYAQVHNEGFSGPVTVPKDTNKPRKRPLRQHIRHMAIPKRQFLGDSEELNDMIHEKIEKAIESLIQ